MSSLILCIVTRCIVDGFTVSILSSSLPSTRVPKLKHHINFSFSTDGYENNVNSVAITLSPVNILLIIPLPRPCPSTRSTAALVYPGESTSSAHSASKSKPATAQLGSPLDSAVTRLLDRLPASRTFPDWRRPKKHEPPLGPNVPLDNVLWTEGAPHCCHIRHRPRYNGTCSGRFRGELVYKMIGGFDQRRDIVLHHWPRAYGCEGDGVLGFQGSVAVWS